MTYRAAMKLWPYGWAGADDGAAVAEWQRRPDEVATR